MVKSNTTHSDKSGIATEAVGYTTSVVAGAISIWANIRHQCYGHFAKLKVFDEIDGKKTDDLNALTTTGSKYLKDSRKISNAYSSAVDDIVKSKGINNTWDKFRVLSRTKQVNILASAITISSVILIATLSLRDRHQLANRLDEADQKQNSASK